MANCEVLRIRRRAPELKETVPASVVCRAESTEVIMPLDAGSMQHTSFSELELYDSYRKYIIHEDDLVSQRATWSITIQGFAFAAASLVLKGFTGHTISPEKCEVLIRFLSLACALVALFSLLSILAAQNSIATLEKSWRTRILNEQFLNTLPKLAGAGSRFSVIVGHFAPLAIQLVFVVLWGLVFVATLLPIAWVPALRSGLGG